MNISDANDEGVSPPRATFLDRLPRRLRATVNHREALWLSRVAVISALGAVVLSAVALLVAIVSLFLSLR